MNILALNNIISEGNIILQIKYFFIVNKSIYYTNNVRSPTSSRIAFTKQIYILIANKKSILQNKIKNCCKPIITIGICSSIYHC